MQYFEDDPAPDCEEPIQNVLCMHNLTDDKSRVELRTSEDTPVAVIIICLSVLTISAFFLFLFLYLCCRRLLLLQQELRLRHLMTTVVSRTKDKHYRTKSSHHNLSETMMSAHQPTGTHLSQSAAKVQPEVISRIGSSNDRGSVYGFKTIVDLDKPIERDDHSTKGRGIVLSRKNSSFYSLQLAPQTSVIRPTTNSENPKIPFANRRETISLKTNRFGS